MEKDVKCPQCGATHAERISRNKYKCSYCGFEFEGEGELKFVDQETNKLKIRQKIEREQYIKVIKKKENITTVILTVTVVLMLFSINVIPDYIFNKKYIEVKGLSNPECFALLEDGPFSTENGDLFITDYGKQFKYNGKTTRANGFGGDDGKYHDTGFDVLCSREVTVKIDGTSYTLRRNADSTMLYLCPEYRHKVFAERSTVGKKHTPYFTLNSEEEMMEYFANRTYMNGKESITIKKDKSNKYILRINKSKYNVESINYDKLNISDCRGSFVCSNLGEVRLHAGKYGTPVYLKFNEKEYHLADYGKN